MINELKNSKGDNEINVSRARYAKLNLKSIDNKWRHRWEALGIYNADPYPGKRKYF